jgi:hypothetical protein
MLCPSPTRERKRSALSLRLGGRPIVRLSLFTAAARWLWVRPGVFGCAGRGRGCRQGVDRNGKAQRGIGQIEPIGDGDDTDQASLARWAAASSAPDFRCMHWAIPTWCSTKVALRGSWLRRWRGAAQTAAPAGHVAAPNHEWSRRAASIPDFNFRPNSEGAIHAEQDSRYQFSGLFWRCLRCGTLGQRCRRLDVREASHGAPGL